MGRKRYVLSKEKGAVKMQKIEFSDMVNGFQAGVFAMLNDKKEELLKRGRTDL